MCRVTSAGHVADYCGKVRCASYCGGPVHPAVRNDGGCRSWELERRVIAGGLSSVHVMISPDLALVNAVSLSLRAILVYVRALFTFAPC
jgi:hypothetical protein